MTSLVNVSVVVSAPPLRRINLRKGHPNERTLPNLALSEAMLELSKALRSPDPSAVISSSVGESFLNYGDNPGNPNVLAALSDFITTTPAVPLAAPFSSYYLAGEIFSNCGLSVVPCSMDSAHGGLDVAALRDQLYADPSVLFVYVIPTHHNPTGATYAAPRRHLLAELCRDFGVHLVADEVYHLLSWDDGKPSRRRPPRLATFNRESAGPFVISVSSLTKVMCPGLRFGWIESSHPSLVSLLNRNGYINSQGGCCPLVGELSRRLLSSGAVSSNAASLTELYRLRAAVVLEELGRCPFPGLLWAPFPPSGGYFAWLRVGEAAGDASAFFAGLEAECNVEVLRGTLCDPIEGGNDIGVDLDRFFRVCFAYPEVEDLREGMRRIVDHAVKKASRNSPT